MRHGIGHGRRGFQAWDAGPSTLQGRSRGLAATSRRGRLRALASRRRGPHRVGVSHAACGRYAHGIAGGEMALLTSG